jgi:type II secretory pathway pseudopilin PulG
MNRRPNQRLPAARRARAGFTLLEAAVATALAGLVIANVTIVLRASQRTWDEQTLETSLDVLAVQTLDRVTMALAGASREALQPAYEPPLPCSDLVYEYSLGMQGEVEQWSAPQRIYMDGARAAVVWAENPGMPEEREVVWGKNVRNELADEVLGNLVDDNGNGIVDEAGLCFTIEGNAVRVRITLEKTNPEGIVVRRSRESLVVCRN